jgi:plasmid stabilization system protein ParE
VRIELHPEARSELRAASLWYEERQERLGDQFLDAVSATLEKIAKAPELYPRWTGTERAAILIRKALVERFPYNVGFDQLESGVLVLTIAHQKRRPLYWLKRASEQPG